MINPDRKIESQENDSLSVDRSFKKQQLNTTVSKQQKYGDNFQTHLLEQYKLYVEMMDRITERRNQMNSFYISVLSGLLVIISLATNENITQFQNNEFQLAALIAIGILGILLCITWRINIQSYKQLNSGKFRVISELEELLPFPCYNREWEFIKNDRRYQAYLTQTNVEKLLPILLAIPYVGLLVYLLLNL